LNHAAPTTEGIRAALAYIPPNLPRDEWAKVAMAIKSEFPDATGLDLFDNWSASDAEGYDAKAVKATWQSVKAGGGVGIATLFHLAALHGYTPPKDGQATPKPSAEEAAQRARDRAQRQQAEQARIDAAHHLAAEQAEKDWAQANEQGESPYLVRKGVQGHGVRYEAGGVLLVPLLDGDNKMWNLQRIAPTKPQDGGTDKLFSKGGRKSGLWHLVGSAGSETDPPPVVLLAEGYATAATLLEATGYPVAVAFDAGNLAHVAKALRQRWPAALLIVAGDDDRNTQAKTGTNPGRVKATAAARAVRGLAIFPEGLPEGGSDFNDLHAHQGGAAGLETVRGIVQTAIDAHAASEIERNKAKAPKARGRQRQIGATTPSETDRGKGFDRFTVDDNGVWYTPPGEEMPRRVCDPLHVTALARDGHDNQAAFLLEFDTRFSKGRKWLMPLPMLAGDGSKVPRC